MLKKYFLTLAAVCLPHLISAQPSNDFVKNHYPNAYAWYVSISEKYPDAKLNSIKFCICDHHHAKSHTIYFPKSAIEFINSWHNAPNQTPEIANKLAQEEYLLLHEAWHALNYDYEKGEFIKTTAIITGASTLLYTIIQQLTNATTPKEAFIRSVITVAILSIGVFGYARLQEKNADHFANQNADQKALEAGITWHAQNKKDLNIPEDSSNIEKLIIEQTNDLAHPRPTKRQQRAQNSYDQRFQATS